MWRSARRRIRQRVGLFFLFPLMTQAPTVTVDDLVAGWPTGPEGPTAQAIRKAWRFAQQAHGTAQHESGEPYVDHGLAVAQIMKELDVDANTIVASILPARGATRISVRESLAYQ